VRLGVAVCFQRLTEIFFAGQTKANVVDPVTSSGMTNGFVSHLMSLNVLRLNKTGRKTEVFDFYQNNYYAGIIQIRWYGYFSAFTKKGTPSH
jgi:hypothetical protein